MTELMLLTELLPDQTRMAQVIKASGRGGGGIGVLLHPYLEAYLPYLEAYLPYLESYLPY